MDTVSRMDVALGNSKMPYPRLTQVLGEDGTLGME